MSRIFKSGKSLSFPLWLFVYDAFLIALAVWLFPDNWIALSGLLFGYVLGLSTGATGALRGGLDDRREKMPDVWAVYDAHDLCGLHATEESANIDRRTRIKREVRMGTSELEMERTIEVQMIKVLP